MEQDTHLIRGRKNLKYFLFALAFSLIVCSAVFYGKLQTGVVLPVFIALLIILSISFPSMNLLEKGILIERKSLFKFLCTKEVIDYCTIEKIELEKGQKTKEVIKNHWFYRAKGLGPRTTGDRVILYLKDGNIRIIQRMGSKENYYDFIEKLKSKIQAVALD